MLTEQQIDVLESALLPYFDDLEQYVIQDIVKRLESNLIYSNTICNELEAMKRLGYSPAKMRREIMKIIRANPRIRKAIEENTAEYKRELAKKMEEVNQQAIAEGKDMVYKASEISMAQDYKIWNDAGKKLSDNPHLKQISEGFAKRIEGDIVNLTGTTGFKNMFGYTDVRQAYTDTLNKAILKLASGVTTPEQELKNCIAELAQSGLKSINYESGRAYSLDTAIRTALRTSYNQLSGTIMDNNIQRMEESLVFVSEHWGARNKGEGVENHEKWQGKVYKLDNSEHKAEEERLGYKIKSLVEATGYDANTSTVVNPKGLHGYNCRHQHYIWFEGISEKPVYPKQPEAKVINGKKYEYSDMTSHQRKLEREIRALKKERMALKELDIDEERQKALRKQISQKKNEYMDFSEQCGIKPKENRLRVERAGADITKTEAYKDYQKIANEVEGGIIEAESSTVASAKKITTEKERSKIIRKAIEAPKPYYAEDLRRAYKNYHVQEKEGYYDVLIHGAPHYLEYEHEYILDKETLYYIISGRKDYKGDNIRLLSCSTGKADKYGNCVAQYLADKLRVEVYAPIDTLNINPSGRLTVGEEDLSEEEGFRVFKPREE